MKSQHAPTMSSGSRRLIQIENACGETFSLAHFDRRKMNISATKKAAALPQPSPLTA
jgi:hypothetical protein